MLEQRTTIEQSFAFWQTSLTNKMMYVDDITACTVATWWDLRKGPLILEGPPGGGKTSLARAIPEIIGCPFYRLQCYRGIGKREALYDWNESLQQILVQEAKQANKKGNYTTILYQPDSLLLGSLGQALLNPAEHVVILIDELDKVPAEESFEGLLLEFLDEAAITIAEWGNNSKSRIQPASGKAPHVIITSNAGTNGQRKSLSDPILRRSSHYLYLAEPDLVRQYEILKDKARSLPARVVKQCALFSVLCRLRTNLEKPLSISETINWVQILELYQVSHLTKELIKLTIPALFKKVGDKKRFLTSLEAIFQEILEYTNKPLEQSNELLLSDHSSASEEALDERSLNVKGIFQTLKPLTNVVAAKLNLATQR